jgi:hypothetical protein
VTGPGTESGLTDSLRCIRQRERSHAESSSRRLSVCCDAHGGRYVLCLVEPALHAGGNR